MQQSNTLITQTFEDVNLMTFTKKDKYLVHRILRDNFKLLEDQSVRFHEAIKEILEQIVFHRESIGVNEQEVYKPRILNFKKQIEEFHKEYKRMLRGPRERRMI